MLYRFVTRNDRGAFSVVDTADPKSVGGEPTGFRQENPGRIKLRPQLVGQPEFRDFLGPMWGGEENGIAVIRYEDQRAYDALSA